MKINEILKKLRNSKGLSQSEMAENLNVSLSSYQKYERDKNSVTPSLDVLIRISDFYNVSIDYLIGREPVDLRIDIVDFVADIADFTEVEKSFFSLYISSTREQREELLSGIFKRIEEGMKNLTSETSDN